MKIDKTTINLINQKNVLNTIRKNESTNRSRIARETGLSLPTVMKITDTLIDLGIVREIGTGKSSGGKPPKLLEFVCNAHYMIGVDLGSNKIIVILTDMNANVICEHTEETKIYEPEEKIVLRIISAIKNVIKESKIEKSRILGIGLGVPGIINPEKGLVVFSPDIGWENVKLAEIIQNEFNIYAEMDNVTRTMAVGEKLYGLGRDMDDYICINLGYGIGASAFINGEIIRGCCGSAGEFGHMKIVPNGPICDCGNRGCLEAVASANAMVKEARKRAKEVEDYSILTAADNNISNITAKLIFELAKSGNKEAEYLVDKSVEYLAIGIGNLINFLDPELIILEGGVSKAGNFLVDKINGKLGGTKMKYAGEKTRLVISELSDYAAAIGSTAMIMDKFIESGGTINRK